MNDYRHRPGGGDYGDAPAPEQSEEKAGTPGKYSLTQFLPRRSAGAPLPADIAGSFGASVGADLSAVRVHTGGESEAAAQTFGARAFAIGQDIHFSPGAYDPGSDAGRRLLAHEVAHTVQQRGAPSASPAAKLEVEVSEPGDTAEREADAAAEAMIAGKPTGPLSSVGSSIGRMILQRDPAGAVAAPAQTVVWRGHTLSTNAAAVRKVLETVILNEGKTGLESFVGSFHLHVQAKVAQKSDAKLPGTPDAGVKSDYEDADKLAAIRTVVDAQKKALDAEMLKAIDDFKKAAVASFKEILKESKDRVEAEQKKYGIKTVGTNAANNQPIYDKADNDYTKGLAAAAELLAKHIGDIEKAKADREKAMETKWTSVGEVKTVANKLAYDDAEKRWRDGEEALSLLRPQFIARYPILASFTTKEQLAKLRTGGLSAKVLGVEIDEKLRNIATAEKLLADGKVDPLALDRVVGVAKLKVKPPAWRTDLFDKPVEDAKKANEPLIPDWLKGILAFTFTVLSFIPPTAAAGAIGDGMLAAASLPDLIKQYEMSKLGGTDFDSQAAIVAAEDLSLTWLALEILTAGVAIVSAVKVFRQLAVPARKVINSKPAPKGKDPEPAADAAEKAAEQQLKTEGNQIKPGLGDKAEARAKKYKKVKNADGDLLDVALGLGAGRRAVLPQDIQLIYVKGKRGWYPHIDALGGKLQTEVAHAATQIREWADLVRANPGKAVEDVVPGFSGLHVHVQKYLKGNLNDSGKFGNALQYFLEPKLAANGLQKQYDLIFRTTWKGSPDIMVELPTPATKTKMAIFDFTGVGSAGTKLKYDVDDPLVDLEMIIEVLHTGP